VNEKEEVALCNCCLIDVVFELKMYVSLYAISFMEWGIVNNSELQLATRNAGVVVRLGTLLIYG
jgi:hypothetical protein